MTNARGYDAFYRALIKEVSIFNVTSALSMEEIKSTTALPLAEARRTPEAADQVRHAARISLDLAHAAPAVRW